MNNAFGVRALELHSLYAWDFTWVYKTLDFIQENGMNTLILHRNDFIDLIIYPGRYFGCEDRRYDSIFERYSEIFRKLYRYTPTRRSGPYQRRAFLKRVLEMAKRKGIDVYIQNKELYFPDIILEFYPELVINGKICANNPFWWEFTRVKYKEFFEEFPEIAGIITSPATGESRVSIKSNRCQCELCRNTKKEDWFRNLLISMYEPIYAAGKKLIVRDFAFDSQAQQDIIKVMQELPEDVIISLKNTPHDYYPTFPENARIGQMANHEQWIEFDSMGQYFGWGIGMADLLEDYRTRLKSALNKNVKGVILRTDWESLDGHSSFSTHNLINQYSIAMLSQDPDTPSVDIYRRFMENENWFADNSTEDEKQDALRYFMDISSRTWSITSKTPFINSCVFSDSSLMPISLQHAFWLAEEKNSLRDWDKSKWEVLYPTRENVEFAIKEKEAALDEIHTLQELCKADCQSIRPEKLKLLRDRVYVNEKYVKLYAAVSKALVLARYIIETNEPKNEPFFKDACHSLKGVLYQLNELEQEFRKFHRETDFLPHTIYTLLDPDRIKMLHKDLYSRTQEILFKDQENMKN